MRTPDDFAVFSPEGGCSDRCSKRLPCGHACPNKCHSDALHAAVHCLERCQRTKVGCDHPCLKPCGDPCGNLCKIKVANVQLLCGHLCVAECCRAQNPKTIKCKVKKRYNMPGCGHENNISCGVDPLMDDLECNAVCGAPLPCGHDCVKPCRTCNIWIDGCIIETQHGRCTTPCGRPYSTCNHNCRTPCHGEDACPLCEERCQVRCAHSNCNKVCSEPCVPCVERCSWSCPHGQCQMPCSVPCDRLPCPERCSEILSCGHRCPSLCGETCPNPRYCQVCGDESVKSMMVDYYECLTYGEIDLDLDACIFPVCGHIITRENLDQHSDMKNHYEFTTDRAGRKPIVGSKASSDPLSVATQKTCPACRSPLRDIHRYGRIERRAWIDEATKKFIVWANARFIPLAVQVKKAEE